MQGSPDKNKNGAQRLISEQWKSQEDYKRMIIALELQNQKYRNQLYELGETVNKILDKAKLPTKTKAAPNLDQQLQLVKKQLHNVNQFIQIYQRQLNSLSGKKKQDQIQTIAASQQLLKVKQSELAALKREVKEMAHKNKALQYKLSQFGKKNKTKSIDQQAMQLKQLINQNKNLKTKLQDLENMQQKRQVWLKNNIQSVKNLQVKIQQQQTKLPKIQNKKTQKIQRSQSSLPKLQSQKNLMNKWLQSNRDKVNSKLQKQIQDLQKINKMVQQKVATTSNQIKQIQQKISKVKSKVQSTEVQLQIQPIEQKNIKKKQVGSQVVKKTRKCRRDWVGKFDSLRFSDTRIVRQQTRIYKILFNSCGYFIFSYYSVKDQKKKYTSKLPFDPSNITLNGKQSTMTVQAPDFIKNIRLKINLKSQKIIQMHVISNLGIQSQFIVQNLVPGGNNNKKSQIKPVSQNKQQQQEVYYEMDVHPNQAITSVFGSYGFRQDEKKNVIAVWLQGLGVQLIQDFVQQLI